MAITYPLVMPAQGVRSITMRMRDQVAVSSSPYTGQQQVYAHPGQWWEADIAFPPMKQDGYADDLAAFLAAARGRYGTFLLGDSSRKTPRGTATATNSSRARVYLGSQSGMVLNTVGWATSQGAILRAGDYIQLGGTNLILSSSEFDHANWGKVNVTVTANSTSSIVGVSNADTLNFAGSGDPSVNQTFESPYTGSPHTFSVFLKTASGTATIPLIFYVGGSAGYYRQDAAVDTVWRRFSVTASRLCRGVSPVVFMGGFGSVATARTVIAEGAQVNVGHTPDGFIFTSSATVNKPYRLHKVIADAESDSSGFSTFDIWPRLRESPADNDGIKFVNPQGTFRLADNVREWSVDEAKIYGVGISAVEAL